MSKEKLNYDPIYNGLPTVRLRSDGYERDFIIPVGYISATDLQIGDKVSLIGTHNETGNTLRPMAHGNHTVKEILQDGYIKLSNSKNRGFDVHISECLVKA